MLRIPRNELARPEAFRARPSPNLVGGVNELGPAAQRKTSPAGRRGRPVRILAHLDLAPRVAQCTNRGFGPGSAVFRVFHDLRPVPRWALARLASSAPRQTQAELDRRTAMWRAALAAGEVSSRAALARREGLSRARITQILRPPLIPRVSPLA
jgi:hypothetical protein